MPEDVPEATNELEGRLAEFHEANGNLEPKKRLKAAELGRLRQAAEAEGASPRAMNRYVNSVLTSEFEELRAANAVLPLAVKANEVTGNEQPELLNTLALNYHLLGRKEDALRGLVPLVPSASRWSFCAKTIPLLATTVPNFPGRPLELPCGDTIFPSDNSNIRSPTVAGRIRAGSRPVS